jgi:multidrug efflux pump subunit AcrA (membrane-fusion protein)
MGWTGGRNLWPRIFGVVPGAKRENTRGAWGVILGGFALCLFVAACEQEQPPVVEQIRAVKTITVQQPASGTVRKLPGIVEATDSSSLSFEVSGNVQQVLVDVGDRVRKDQILAVMDKRPFELAVQAAESSVQKAQATLTEIAVEFERQKTLFEEGWISQAALDQVNAEHQTAKAGVDFERTQVGLAQRDLEKPCYRRRSTV